MGYYDCPEPSLDPPDGKVVGYCCKCGGEVFRYDPVISYMGGIFHEECAPDDARFYDARLACDWD